MVAVGCRKDNTRKSDREMVSGGVRSLSAVDPRMLTFPLCCTNFRRPSILMIFLSAEVRSNETLLLSFCSHNALHRCEVPVRRRDGRS